MANEQSGNKEWREGVGEQKNTLKLGAGENSIFTFKDEGETNIHPDYGTSIKFLVQVSGEEEERFLYVKENNYSLLRQIKELGTLTNLKVELSRTGSKKSDTRYTIKKHE
jgi:hypothetical protein